MIYHEKATSLISKREGKEGGKEGEREGWGDCGMMNETNRKGGGRGGSKG